MISGIRLYSYSTSCWHREAWAATKAAHGEALMSLIVVSPVDDFPRRPPLCVHRSLPPDHRWLIAYCRWHRDRLTSARKVNLGPLPRSAAVNVGHVRGR